MIRLSNEKAIFELTQPHEKATMQALQDYFDGMFFAN